MAYRRGSLDRGVYMLRDLNDQARRRPRRTNVMVGDWRLDVDPDTGDLIAVHSSGVRRVLAALEEPSPDDG